MNVHDLECYIEPIVLVMQLQRSNCLLVAMSDCIPYTVEKKTPMYLNTQLLWSSQAVKNN